jgi:hypothetical protein
MRSRRWLNSSQPQTLVIACFLLYINGGFALLALLASLQTVVAIAGAFQLAGIAAGYGIANEQRWGYVLGLVTAVSPVVFQVLARQNPLAIGAIPLIFEIALIALLLHTQSREYQKIWFK